MKKCGTKIWFFFKFFSEEGHADQFMAGNLYLNTLAYFKQEEREDSDGRRDSTEAIAMWWQPDDLVITFTVPGVGETTITKKDLAGPVSIGSVHHDYMHLLCLYALHTTGFECVDGKIECSPEDAEELRRQVKIDERCFKFGKFAVITPAVQLLNRLREALNSQGYGFTGKLVKYYDEDVFHGQIPTEDIPFTKQKRFSYQREFRVCVDTGTQQEAAITINIGDISHICAKRDATQLPGIFEVKEVKVDIPLSAPAKVEPGVN